MDTIYYLIWLDILEDDGVDTVLLRHTINYILSPVEITRNGYGDGDGYGYGNGYGYDWEII